MTVTKAEMLAAIDAEHAIWESLVGQVDEARLEEPGVIGPWSFKDVAGHMAGWDRRTLDLLEAAVRGEPEPPRPWPPECTHVDQINAWIYDQHHLRPAADVLHDASDTYTRLRAAVSALRDEALTDPNRFTWMKGDALGASIVDRSYFGHLHEEHEAEIRAWLAGGGAS